MLNAAKCMIRIDYIPHDCLLLACAFWYIAGISFVLLKC